MYKMNHTLSLCSLILLGSCCHHSHIVKKKIIVPYQSEKITKTAENVTATPPTITVWIHGTLLTRKSQFYRFFDGKIGIKKASTIVKSHKSLPCIASTLTAQAPELFSFDTFYFFGWTGKLCNDDRLVASKQLYLDLQGIITEFQEKYGTYPTIRIVGHSHGGNVALYLAHMKQPQDKELTIESLVLLACPVQRRSVQNIYDPMFKKIYSLYSSLDLTQVLAPQRPRYRPFSSKQFPKHHKLIQAKIKRNGHALLHTAFTRKQFCQALPVILKELDTINNQILNKIYNDGHDLVIEVINQNPPKKICS